MTTYKKDSLLLTEVEEPFSEIEKKTEEIEDPIFVDMTKHSGITGVALRVELRRIRDPAIGKVLPENKIIDDNFIIGLINPESLPEEGKSFRMSYHILNNLLDFGNVDSVEPIKDLVKDEAKFYFSTSEGQWRLMILDIGN